MQRMKSGLLIFLLPPLALAGNQWNVTLPGGNMRFQGIIIAESCRVEAGDR
ncbi:TPA: type 1 fimbrial protein, partial [Klebsiella oxytoca]|nr:type 1 fimbrial protein [Klebsiella oxytoca]